MEITWLTWTVTIIVIVALLAFDYFFHVRKAHTPTIREAAVWSAIYVGLALVFGLVFFAFGDTTHAVEYYAGYLTEKALSVDNLFVFLVIMASFQVPRDYQQKVLLFGITFALISRTVFILIGAVAIEMWSDVFYLFGLFLILIAGQQLKGELTGDKEEDEADNFMVRMAKKFLPASDTYDGDKLFTMENGKKVLTPMLLVMVAIGATDILFAFDSIPAIYGLTQEPYIVFTATAFSLMGLRQLYFLIDGLLDRLVYLAYGLAAVLGFIGIKLILHALHENNLPFINGGENVPVAEVPTTTSLLVIVALLGITVVASLWSPKGRALRALQNAERYSHRYTVLPEDASPEERTQAVRLMDRWTQEAEGLDQKWRDRLLDHKDKYSRIIRTAHETRLAAAESRGADAEVSRRIVEQDGPTV
ncbi:TerC family protein [Nocardia zapadnayensis]|uniref:TerC family protein n=1 Tax=Brevibacterium sp. R8603A2 TaxID=2929779 RepID=UPI001FF734DE|nr:MULTISPECIES: TerC family protein [Actinomycetes]MCK1802502.1 TerC family protein [Brevibacterium sp. R8603A2]MCX0277916.1 TerC family protein [Nocardia zapadnayensis]